MQNNAAVPTDLLDELRALHRRDPDLLDSKTASLGLRPLSGGRNNRVFAWNSADGEVCFKLYRIDKRDRAACEFNALNHVAEHGVTNAPEPLWHDPDPDLPAVAMSMVAGEPVPHLAEPSTAVRAVVGVLGQLRALPLGPFTDLPRVDTAKSYVSRLTEIWPSQLDEYASESMTADMRGLLDAWHRHNDAAVLNEPAPRIFSRGDSNLLNWLWADPEVSVVDWEFAGYSDTAWDAAEFIEHLSAHPIDDALWISLLAEVGVEDEVTRRRFAAAQRTVALRWLSVLWKRRHKRVEEFDYQRKRVTELMNSDFLSLR